MEGDNFHFENIGCARAPSVNVRVRGFSSILTAAVQWGLRSASQIAPVKPHQLYQDNCLHSAGDKPAEVVWTRSLFCSTQITKLYH